MSLRVGIFGAKHMLQNLFKYHFEKCQNKLEKKNNEFSYHDKAKETHHIPTFDFCCVVVYAQWETCGAPDMRACTQFPRLTRVWKYHADD